MLYIAELKSNLLHERKILETALQLIKAGLKFL